MCLEIVRLLQLLADNTVIVDLAIDGQRNFSIIAKEGLGAAIWRGYEKEGSERGYMLESYQHQRYSGARARELLMWLVLRIDVQRIVSEALLVLFAIWLPPINF